MTPRAEYLSDRVTLYLGDCREILKMLGKVDAVVTDPPYGISFRSNYRTIAHKKIVNDEASDALVWATKIPAKFASYIFCRWDNLAVVPKPKSAITWVKNNWSMGDLEHEHARQTELILYYPGPRHYWPEIRPTDVVQAQRTGNENHPSEKPVSLMMSVCRWTVGQIFDPFMGSGSTGIAAAKLGRPFIGIEIDPEHFDIACRRISEALEQPDMFIDAVHPMQQMALAL